MIPFLSSVRSAGGIHRTHVSTLSVLVSPARKRAFEIKGKISEETLKSRWKNGDRVVVKIDTVGELEDWVGWTCKQKPLVAM